MTSPSRISWEKALLLLALAGTFGSAMWWWQQRPALQRLRTEQVVAELTGAAYAPVTWPVAETAARPWVKPGAQSAGAGWVYELFTPPVIYYHATARAFAVTPPDNRTVPAESVARTFGFELLAVKREPFRLQLVGYVGVPGDYTAAFVSEQVPETLLARTGRRFAELGLTLKTFEIRKIALAPDRPQPVFDIAAVATLQDERTGGEVTLDTRGLRLTDTPLAVLCSLAEAKAKPRTLRVGDTFQQDDATYRIEHIQLDPPEVVVARQTDLPYPETRVLRPAPAAQLADKSSTSRRRFNDSSHPAFAENTRP